MTKEARQTVKTVLVATLIAAILVGLAWMSMADLVLVTLAALLGLAVGWTLGARHVAAQAQQKQRTRRARSSVRQPRKRG